MNEGKNPNPRIYQQSEAGELNNELADVIEQMMEELLDCDTTLEALTKKLTELIATTRSLKATLETDAKADMHAASISYNDAEWKLYQIVREKSYIRKQDGRSAIFHSSHAGDDEDMNVHEEYDAEDNSIRGGGYVHEEYDDDYYGDNRYGVRVWCTRGEYDHAEEAS